MGVTLGGIFDPNCLAGSLTAHVPDEETGSEGSSHFRQTQGARLASLYLQITAMGAGQPFEAGRVPLNFKAESEVWRGARPAQGGCVFSYLYYH